MAPRRIPLKPSSTKKEVFKFYGWDIHDPNFNKRYTHLKSTAKDVWHTILGNISPGASLENQKSSRLGPLQSTCLATAKEKLWGKLKGQAAEEILLGDGRGLIEHIVSTAQREYFASGAGKKRMRIWREEVKGTMGVKASAASNNNTTDHEIVDCEGTSGSSPYLGHSMRSGKADEDPGMRRSHASTAKHTQAAQAKQLLPQYPPGQGKASVSTQIPITRSSTGPFSLPPRKRYFVIPNPGLAPPPSLAPQAVSRKFRLPSLSRDYASSAAGDIWQPIPQTTSFPDSGGLAPDWISNWMSEVPSFDSQSHDDEVHSPRTLTTDQHLADVDDIIRVLDPVVWEDQELDDVFPTPSDVGTDIDCNIDWGLFINESAFLNDAVGFSV